MLTEHPSNLRVVLLVNAKLNVVCVTGFVGFAGCGFSRVTQMFLYDVYVTSRFVLLFLNVFCFDDAKHLNMGDSTFHEGDGFSASFVIASPSIV